MRIKNFPSNPEMRYQRGAAAVELAFVMVVMLLLVAGTIGFGRAFWYADALYKATRDGARLLSTWAVSDISAGVVAARTITINSANAANVSPPLGTVNVLVQCLDDAFSSVACADGTTPANVRVSISGFNVTLGEWFPFIGAGGLIDYGSIGLSPHTTMRYMN
ncbi:pilus assembly protein [Polaromonas sp. P1(28)-13]|nr:pilus assembly protein [Polaromonas sp. P1(28)-13]